MSDVTRWVRYLTLNQKSCSKTTELSNKNIFVTNWGSFVLLQIKTNAVTNWGSFIITNWDSYYRLGQPLLQNRAKCIANSGRYYKLGQLLQIWA